MSTLDQKRLLKLAGLLKEGMEEWPRGLAEEEDVPPAKDDQLDIPMGYGAEAVRDRIEKMNARAREGVGPDDFLLLLDPDAMIKSGIDTPEKLDQYFADEKKREDYKASLHRGFDDDYDFSDMLSDNELLPSVEPKEPEASAEEEELERLPKQMGMGRGARLEETYIDNMKEEVDEHTIEKSSVKTPAGMELLRALEMIEKKIMGQEAWEEAEAEALKRKAQSVADTLTLQQQSKLQEAIRALVREVLLEKKAKTYKGKSMRLGGGGRFAKFVDSLKKSGKSEEQARAIAYKAGVKKYGKEKMKKMAAAGKKRAAKKD